MQSILTCSHLTHIDMFTCRQWCSHNKHQAAVQPCVTCSHGYMQTMVHLCGTCSHVHMQAMMQLCFNLQSCFQVRNSIVMLRIQTCLQSCLHAGDGAIVAAVPVARAAAKLRAARYIAQSLPSDLTKGAGGGFPRAFSLPKGVPCEDFQN